MIDIRVPGQAVVETPARTPVVATPGAPNDIVVEGLVKDFGSYRAVNDQPLREPGEIYGFGPNGPASRRRS